MMSGDKARELFSDYREGTISSNLRTSLEQALKADSKLLSDYREFDGMMASLESSATESFEVPFDLHDKIMARIDKSVYDVKESTKKSWFANWKLIGFTGIAALAIIGTVVSLKYPGSGPAVSGISSMSNPSGLVIKSVEGQLRVTHSATQSVVVVKNDATGDLVTRFDLGGKKLDSPLENPGVQAVLLIVQTEDEAALIAVPGSQRSRSVEGSGTFKDLAKAIADASGEPVLVGVKDPNAKVAWIIDPTDLSHSKGTDSEFSIETRNGMPYLTD